MGKLYILGPNGHSEVTWDIIAATEGDAEALIAIQEAERIVKEAWARKSAVLKVEKGKPAQRMDVFDPEAEEIVIIPRITGGRMG